MLDTLYPTVEEKRQLQSLIPIGRLGKPEDIAGLTLFLTRGEGSYLHGQIILLDGGRTYQPKYTEGKERRVNRSFVIFITIVPIGNECLVYW